MNVSGKGILLTPQPFCERDGIGEGLDGGDGEDMVVGSSEGYSGGNGGVLFVNGDSPDRLREALDVVP